MLKKCLNLKKGQPLVITGPIECIDFIRILTKQAYEMGVHDVYFDFVDSYLVPASTDDMMSMIKDVMLKCVTIVTGFEPFKFVCLKGNGYLFGDTPKVADLIANAKGEYLK